MTRRTMIQRLSALLTGLWAAKPVLGESPALPAVEVAKTDPVKPATDNVGLLVRNWYVNRNPLLTRFPWVPTDKTEFWMYSHRMATAEEITESPHDGFFTVGTAKQQWCQPFCFPFPEKSKTPPDFPKNSPFDCYNMPGGVKSPFDWHQTMQLQNMVDDTEMSLYYGVGCSPDAVERGESNIPRMHGLRSILTTNNRKAPAGFEGYSGDDFIRDTLTAARDAGGDPDLLLFDTRMVKKFAEWQWPFKRIDAGQTVFGTPIITYEFVDLPGMIAPVDIPDALKGITLVEAPLLRPYTAVALTSSEVYIRPKVEPQSRPISPGMNSDFKREWYTELAIEVVNEHHSAWLEASA